MWSNKIIKSILFLFVFLIFILNASGNIESIDGLASLNMSRNYIYQGTWEVSPPEYNVGMGTNMVDGKYYSGASVGYAVAIMPVVLITKYIYEKNSFTPINRFPLESDYLLTFLASFINPILGFVLFVVMYLILKFISKKDGVSFFLAAVMSLSTNLLVLSKHSFVHILFTLLVMIGFYGIIRLLDNKKQYGWVVLILVDLVLLKYCYNLTYILPIIGLYFFVWWYLVDKWSVKMILMFLGTSAVLGLVGMKVSGLNLGNIGGGLIGEGTRKDVFQAIWGQLFSSGRSMFVYSPILVLSMYWSFRNFKNIYSKFFLLMVSIYVGFYSMFDIWHGELSYGPRYLAVIIPFGIMVLAVNWKQIDKWIFGILVVLGLYVQLVGIVIPYGVQYPEFDMLNISTENIKSRQDKFDYWSLGEFIPRYSPPYRLKRVLVTRLLSLKDIFKRISSEAILVSNAMLPDKNSIGRGVESVFYVKVLKDVTFDKIDIEVDKKYKSLVVCDKNNCQKNKHNFDLKKGDILKFDFGKNEKYFITKLVLGDIAVNLSDYRLNNTDRFLNRNNMLGQEKSIADLKIDWWYTGMVNNLTPDFWWVKTRIYENLF